MSVLRNVRVKWASVQEPNTKYEPVYEIVAILSKEQAAEFVDKGLRVKNEDGELTYRFKKKQFGMKKTQEKFEKPAPRVVDAEKNPFTGLIGNGSLCNIQYEMKSGDFPQPWVKAELAAVQVVELVEFNAGGTVDEFEDVGETKVIAGSDSGEADDDDDIPF